VTIRKGEEWGIAVDRPPGLVVAGSDAELARLVRGAAPLAVADGDVHRSLGGPEGRDRLQRVPVDLLRVSVDGAEHVAVAHVVARRSWWRGSIVAVMNVDHLGDWNVAPRAHPNDGRADIVEVAASMSLRARLQARRRLPLGTHVPHPAIATSTSNARTWEFANPLSVWIDGVRAGSCRRLAVAVEPDAFELHV
jgi:hypothetical protein